MLSKDKTKTCNTQHGLPPGSTKNAGKMNPTPKQPPPQNPVGSSPNEN